MKSQSWPGSGLRAAPATSPLTDLAAPLSALCAPAVSDVRAYPSPTRSVLSPFASATVIHIPARPSHSNHRQHRHSRQEPLCRPSFPPSASTTPLPDYIPPHPQPSKPPIPPHLFSTSFLPLLFTYSNQHPQPQLSPISPLTPIQSILNLPHPTSPKELPSGLISPTPHSRSL